MACVCSTVWRQPSSRSTVYTPTVKPAAPVINCHTKSSARRAVAHIALAAASLGPPRAWLLRCSAAPLLFCIARGAPRRAPAARSIRNARAEYRIDVYRRIQYSIFDVAEDRARLEEFCVQYRLPSLCDLAPLPLAGAQCVCVCCKRPDPGKEGCDFQCCQCYHTGLDQCDNTAH